MKAFIGRLLGEEWGMPIHGETAGQAKGNFQKWAPPSLDQYDFIFVRVTRYPKLDDKPFTPENLITAGFHYVDEDWFPLTSENFVNDCRCEVCRKALI